MCFSRLHGSPEPNALGQACDFDNVALCDCLIDFIAAFAVEDRLAMAVSVPVSIR